MSASKPAVLAVRAANQSATDSIAGSCPGPDDGDTVHVLSRLATPPRKAPVLSWSNDGTRAQAGPEVLDSVTGGALARMIAAAQLAGMAARHPSHVEPYQPSQSLELALRYQLATEQTSLILVHVREPGQKAIGLPALQKNAHMQAAGWGGVGTVADHAVCPSVYSRRTGLVPPPMPAPEDVIVESHLCLGPLEEGEAEFRRLSDDQAICIGYANNLSATNHQPVEQWLVRRLARRLHALRAEAPALALGPDGKVLVVVREEGASWTLEGFSCSLQQRAAADDVALHRAVRLALDDEMGKLCVLLPGLSAELPQQLTVNGAGAFDVGGPEGDNGLSGKKLVMDAYGPRVAIGGGAWSGKDFFKADRVGGLHARRLAKLVVQLGLATEARVTLHWFPGDREARVLGIETPPGQSVCASRVSSCVDLTLERSGENFAVDDLVEVARWGHFEKADYPWERVGRL